MTSVDARAAEIGSAGQPAWQGLRTAAWIVALASAVALLVYASHVLLLLFAGLLLGVLLDALTDHLMRWTGLGRRGGLTVVVFALLGAFAGLGWLVVPSIVEQATSLADRLPSAWGSTWGRVVTGHAGSLKRVEQAVQQVDPQLVRPVVKSLSATLTVITYVVVIAVIGVYAAARPGLYVDGFVRLLPRARRDQAREVLFECGHQLRRWMLGAATAMTTAGLGVGVGLWALGVPYALGLGLLAAVLELVPNFGPLAAALPALLLSAAGDNDAVWWHVAIMYTVVQGFQSYVVQPLVQQHMVEVPPILLIIVLVAMGWLMGALGVVTAVPLLVVVMTVVKLVYQRDVLGERVHLAS